MRTANTILSFGAGALLVDTGTYADAPAVFIKSASAPGPIGERAPDSEQAPLDRLVAGEVVLTFPTEDRAQAVADLLTSKPSTQLKGRHFPAGTIVHMNGIPVSLVTAVNLETHSANWKLIEDASLIEVEDAED